MGSKKQNAMPSRLGVDKRGFVLTLPSKYKIRSPFTQVVKALVPTILESPDIQPHSIYLYGSVATGKAIVGKSDLDVTVVLKHPITPQVQQTFKGMESRLRQAFPFLPKVDFDLGTYSEILQPNNKYSWGFWIKHCCTCVAGEDLGKAFPRFKPTAQVAYGINGDVSNWIQRTREGLGAATTPEEIQVHCRTIMRKLVRTGFSLVMEREESWTGDLTLGGDLFLKHYPEYTVPIQQAQQLALAPTSETSRIFDILDTLGEPLCDMMGPC